MAETVGLFKLLKISNTTPHICARIPLPVGTPAGLQRTAHAHSLAQQRSSSASSINALNAGNISIISRFLSSVTPHANGSIFAFSLLLPSARTAFRTAAMSTYAHSGRGGLGGGGSLGRRKGKRKEKETEGKAADAGDTAASKLLHVEGDLVESTAQYVVHQTNCLTTKGAAKGLAKILFEK